MYRILLNQCLTVLVSNAALKTTLKLSHVEYHFVVLIGLGTEMESSGDDLSLMHDVWGLSGDIQEPDGLNNREMESQVGIFTHVAGDCCWLLARALTAVCGLSLLTVWRLEWS